MIDPANEYHQWMTRRRFFEGAGLKVGGLALAGLMGGECARGEEILSNKGRLG